MRPWAISSLLGVFLFQIASGRPIQVSVVDHPVNFQCIMTSTAVVSTVITGCTSPGAGLKRYITNISYNNSIVATTTNFMTIQYGTGSNCATGPVVIYRQANSVAFLAVSEGFVQPLETAAATDICFLHPGAGTRLINITGYVAP